jgi:hypothetical protein
MTRTAHLSLMSVLLAPATGMAAVHQPNATIVDAVVLDVTEDGFAALGAVIPAVIPAEIEVPDFVQEVRTSSDWGECFTGYHIGISDAFAEIEVSSAVITPRNGHLDVDAELLVNINDAANPFAMTTMLLCIWDTCDGHVEPFNVDVHTTMALQLVDDPADPEAPPTLDAIVGDLEIIYDLTGDQVNLNSCAIGTIEDILNILGLSMVDLVIDLAGDTLLGAVADMGPELEAAIEDAFAATNISQTMDVSGVALNVELHPEDIEITTEGLRINMEGAMGVDGAAACIDDDPLGSLATASAIPGIGTAPAGIAAPQLAFLLSDDIANQALYSLWRGGLLCYEITEEATGFPLDTSLLGLFAGDAFDDLFPESAPLAVSTRPHRPPEVDYVGTHDVDLKVRELVLEFVGEVDHRNALILGMDLAIDAGIDLEFDDALGALDILVDLGSENVTPTVASNEFVPEASADIEADFGSVIDLVVSSMLGGLVSDMSFTLPSMSGVGLTAMELEAHGTNEDWLGAFAGIGAVTYGAGGEGCASEDGGCGGGCEGSGCGTGGRLGGNWGFLAFGLLLAHRRRQT